MNPRATCIHGVALTPMYFNFCAVHVCHVCWNPKFLTHPTHDIQVCVCLVDLCSCNCRYDRMLSEIKGSAETPPRLVFPHAPFLQSQSLTGTAHASTFA